MISREGIHKMCEFFFEAEEEFSQSSDMTLVLAFVHTLRKHSFTDDEIQDIISEEKYKLMKDTYHNSSDIRSPLTFDLKHIDKFTNNDKYFGGCRKEEFSYDNKNLFTTTATTRGSISAKAAARQGKPLMGQSGRADEGKTPSYGRKVDILSNHDDQEESMPFTPSYYSQVLRTSEDSDEEFRLSLKSNLNDNETFDSPETDGIKNKSLENCFVNNSNYPFYNKNIQSFNN